MDFNETKKFLQMVINLFIDTYVDPKTPEKDQFKSM